MNTQEIGDLVRKDPLITNFQGVFSIDTLPKLKPNASYVVNTSPSYVSQGHWTGIHDKTFFCSYGIEPKSYGIKGIKSYNDTQFQSLNSSVCGYYVVLVLGLLSRGYELEEISNIFIYADNVNDDIVRAYYGCK